MLLFSVLLPVVVHACWLPRPVPRSSCALRHRDLNVAPRQCACCVPCRVDVPCDDLARACDTQVRFVAEPTQEDARLSEGLRE
eukprot:3596883-Pyramimonas_sp.AAC.1